MLLKRRGGTIFSRTCPLLSALELLQASPGASRVICSRQGAVDRTMNPLQALRKTWTTLSPGERPGLVRGAGTATCKVLLYRCSSPGVQVRRLCRIGDLWDDMSNSEEGSDTQTADLLSDEGSDEDAVSSFTGAQLGLNPGAARTCLQVGVGKTQARMY